MPHQTPATQAPPPPPAHPPVYGAVPAPPDGTLQLGALPGPAGAFPPPGFAGPGFAPAGPPPPPQPWPGAVAAALLNLSGLGLGYVVLRQWVGAVVCWAATVALVVAVLPADPDGIPAGVLVAYGVFLVLAALDVLRRARRTPLAPGPRPARASSCRWRSCCSRSRWAAASRTARPATRRASSGCSNSWPPPTSW
ncbi:hypothetical protein AB6O49_09620 [Streptomyces sp. SBR177]